MANGVSTRQKISNPVRVSGLPMARYISGVSLAIGFVGRLRVVSTLWNVWVSVGRQLRWMLVKLLSPGGPLDRISPG
jgi:hypothetical protein